MIAAGTKLGRYEIRSKIGEGGMGEVYLAEDTRLHRKVALKILPAELAANKDRMRRFEQEAQAAAALNHPNIATIYEIGAHEVTNFIAMEFIDGLTLREKIHREKTELRRLLRFLQHTAEGLAKAHAAGIIHRDLKPDNIMVTRDAHAKILDFGLAKLIDPQPLPRSDSSEVATAVMPEHSTPGAVMGTVGYMSPEQAQGRTTEIDQRSDIFSFGCILYEAITRRKAFEGKDPIDSLNKIIREQPQPVSELVPDAPYDLQRIVRRCLAKDADERYQSIKEVAIELKEVRRELESAASVHTTASTTSAPATQQSEAPVSSSATSVVSSLSSTAPSTPSSAEYLFNQVKSHKFIAAGISLLIFAAIGALAFGIYKFASQPKSSALPNVKFTRLTTGGRIGNASIMGGAAISADGKWVAFGGVEQQKNIIWLEQVATKSVHQLLEITEGGYGDLSFSPDGEFIYYALYDESHPKGTLFQMPIIGGTPRRILDDIGSPVVFSHDGKRIAFIRLDNPNGKSALVIANADGSNEKELASRQRPDSYAMEGPSWSPDDKRIATGVNRVNSSGTVIELPVDGGAEKSLTSQKWARACRVAWLSDGTGLLVTAYPETSSTGTQLWFLAQPSGEVRQITNDLGGYGSVSLGVTADSKTLVTVQEDWSSQIWVVTPSSDAAPARRLTTGKYDGANGVGAFRDGRIVHATKTSENFDLWIMNSDGTDNRQITTDAFIEEFPVFSRDGRYVLFRSDRAGSKNIWKVDADGNNLKQLTDGTAGDSDPDGTPDGQWVVFSSRRAGAKSTLWKVPINGGTPVQLTDYPSWGSLVSPDGKTIVCMIGNDSGKPPKLALVSIDGGAPTKTFDIPPNLAVWKWAPDGTSITYAVGFSSSGFTILKQSLDGSKPMELVKNKDNQIYDFVWTPDGKQLIISYGPQTDDVVLLRDFK